MKTQKILIITMLLCLVGLATACKDDNNTSNLIPPIEPEPQPEPRECLVGTKWRLVGFYDIETGELVEALPVETPYMPPIYTLRFTGDSVGFGRVIRSEITLFQLSNNLFPAFNCYFLDWQRQPSRDTSGYGWDNASLFYAAIETTTHYEAVGDELRIYYVDKEDNNRKKYLLYSYRGTEIVDTNWKPKETVEISGKYLIGTDWRLKAFVDEKNNIGRPPNPNNWKGFFNLSFHNDIAGYWLPDGYLITGTSAGNWQDGEYLIDYNTNILTTSIGTTKASEEGDGFFWYDFFIGWNQFHFKLYQNELRIYFNSNQNYLLFTRR